MTLLIWDIMGDLDKLPEIIHSYNQYSPQKKYFENAKGAIIVCDITRRNTLENIADWIKTFKEVTGDAPMILLGNKADLRAIAKVENSDLDELASKYNIKYLFTSAKTGQNVEQAFSKLSKVMAMNHLKNKQMET
jgi:small GTP-binding protein